MDGIFEHNKEPIFYCPRCGTYKDYEKNKEQINKIETEFARAEAYANAYTDARHYTSLAEKNTAWWSCRAGYLKALHDETDNSLREATLRVVEEKGFVKAINVLLDHYEHTKHEIDWIKCRDMARFLQSQIKILFPS